MASTVSGWTRRLANFVLSPRQIIRNNAATYTGNRVTKARRTANLLTFYVTNLLLYAVPLTASGFGVQEGQAPQAIAPLLDVVAPSAAVAWQFLRALAVNSAYLLVLSGVTLFAFHIGVLLTRSSNGILQSFHTVVYSTGIYLAVIFTITWALSTSAQIAVADELLIAIQKQFVYFFIDLSGQQIGLPGGRPGAVDLAELTLLGQLAVAGLLSTIAYFFYSLYLGARLNHRASRIDGLVSIVFVGSSPSLYVMGSILFTTAL